MSPLPLLADVKGPLPKLLGPRAPKYLFTLEEVGPV